MKHLVLAPQCPTWRRGAHHNTLIGVVAPNAKLGLVLLLSLAPQHHPSATAAGPTHFYATHGTRPGHHGASRANSSSCSAEHSAAAPTLALLSTRRGVRELDFWAIGGGGSVEGGEGKQQHGNGGGGGTELQRASGSGNSGVQPYGVICQITIVMGSIWDVGVI
ncbi:hypothetical protein Syun_029204 [Stephania yunnanensis]|uniref:Uncharacterized protein n=1 Tax=Stephania yunnanensis TaxID=152371 RepID=A0AAP0E7I6_9MAGN